MVALKKTGGGKSYLKGNGDGTINVQAIATNTPSIKSEVVEFNVASLAKIDWNTTKINSSTYGFNNETLYTKAKTATSIEFKKDSSTSGAFVGEETTKDYIYASYDSIAKKLSIWSNYKIAFENNDMVETGGWAGPFYKCESLTNIALNNIDINRLTSIAYMFNSCWKLTSLDLSSFDTCNVTNMESMFWGCKELTNISNLSSFNTKNVTNMDSMFGDCVKLLSLDLSSFNTSNVTTMANMFTGCLKINSLDLSTFDTKKVTQINNMFGNDYEGDMALESIVFGNNFYTNNVENMSNMFQGCPNLTTLDLSNFSFNKTTDASLMFKECSKLTTIYVKEGTDLNNISGLTDHTDMFDGCEMLKGGAGTQYSSTIIDKTYARVDGGEANPGYFTTK